MIYAIDRQTKEHFIVTNQDDFDAEQYIIVLAGPDGWIDWQGGESPLPDNAKCEVKLMNSNVVHASWPGSVNWGTGTSVKFYRPIIEVSEGSSMNTPNFTVDLTTLDIPSEAKWVTQDENGRVDAWRNMPLHSRLRRGWKISISSATCVDTHFARNPNWNNAITEWPLPEAVKTEWRGPKMVCRPSVQW